VFEKPAGRCAGNTRGCHWREAIVAVVMAGELERVPKKCDAVFGKEHAQSKISRARSTLNSPNAR